MKKCPRCELNWIQDNQDECDVCKLEKSSTPSSNFAHKPLHSFSIREFVIKNSISSIGCETGYDFYDLSGRKLGVVFSTHDKKDSPSFGKCEMCFYPKYENEFRRYHRFKINGERLDFSILQSFFLNNNEKRILID